MKDNSQYQVWVRCMTYNHSKFIRDALDGFCTQQTNFPFVCAIVDDASTDGEQEIIKQYLQENFDLSDKERVRNEETDDYTFVFAQHKTNKQCFFAVYYLKYNHHSINKPKLPYLKEWENIRYEALCEGDDYWTCSEKLQLQIDFLNAHPDHSLCFHANLMIYNDGKSKESYPYNDNKEDCPIKDIILGGGGFMATNSMVYVRNMGYDYRIWSKSSHVGDRPLMLTLAARGKVAYINMVMSCYRVAVQGSWTQRILMDKKKNKEHYKQTLLSWKEYDEWTEYKYHNYIQQRIRKNVFHFWVKKIPVLNRIILILKRIRK